MNLSVLNTELPTGVTTQPTPARAQSESFEQALAESRAAGQATAPRSEDKLRKAAGELVAAAFLLPMLDHVRNSTMKSDLFGGGMDQDAMRQMLDVRLAGEIASSPSFPLVDALVEQFRPKPSPGIDTHG